MEFLVLLVIILIVALPIYLVWRNSAVQKGKRGEKRVSAELAQLSDQYSVLNDLVFYTEKGTTQIDHLVVSKYGVFVIETKNYRGEIYGDDNRQEWTQLIVTDVTYAKKWWKTYTYVTKSHFYNPVKQTIGHSLKVRELLAEFPHLTVVPIVAFAGDARLGNVDSKHHVVYYVDLPSVIGGYKNICLNDEDVQKVISILQENNVRQTVNNRRHVKNLRIAEKEYNRTIDSGICPKCGGRLVQRRGKYGTFYSCSNYPHCKFTVN